MSSSPRIAFKAGRAFRREGTNWVDPAPDKGAIILQDSPEEGLLLFIWKNRTTGRVEEELTLFPSDASFVPVPQAVGGRVYVLKFESSDNKYFFWLQVKYTELLRTTHILPHNLGCRHDKRQRLCPKRKPTVCKPRTTPHLVHWFP
ncbi:hypothetical protein QCA50_006690 [Cerrena zonata]|uniref:Pru domain-containing protein n=1 Tax=Cerrena zonata TaxID=2478898 RepID=A0AAW0G9I3_9APHY